MFEETRLYAAAFRKFGLKKGNIVVCNVRRSSHVDGRSLWEKTTSSTDGAPADIARCYTVEREGDALRLTSRRIQLTFCSHERDS
ncbi:hypothetical protein NPIL_335671 [Nephila pilipes]|uniref:Uncharacterized protein n=1 Tax=Nephila pilipes TaxID=299642 RepID=A0A8X6P270_NEPPI|nr:hypothetical protein NPIL_335671 [Nephila pilipes]